MIRHNLMRVVGLYNSKYILKLFVKQWLIQSVNIRIARDQCITVLLTKSTLHFEMSCDGSNFCGFKISVMEILTKNICHVYLLMLDVKKCG